LVGLLGPVLDLVVVHNLTKSLADPLSHPTLHGINKVDNVFGGIHKANYWINRTLCPRNFESDSPPSYPGDLRLERARGSFREHIYCSYLQPGRISSALPRARPLNPRCALVALISTYRAGTKKQVTCQVVVAVRFRGEGERKLLIGKRECLRNGYALKCL
jgi:hypothetical protein